MHSIETMHTDKMEEKIEFLKRMLRKPFKDRKTREKEKFMKEYYLSSSLDDFVHTNGQSFEGSVDLDATKRTTNKQKITGGGLSRSTRSDTELARLAKEYDMLAKEYDSVASEGLILNQAP